jgi:CheY-like chemotaxis protein
MNAPRQALVVDDNELNSRLVAVFLKRLGWQPQVVSSGNAALRWLAEQTFELVLLDLRMPEMDGTEVCRRIRQQPELARLPVVAYTAHSTPEEKERILAAGFNGLLVKPLSFIDLRDACDEHAPGQ